MDKMIWKSQVQGIHTNLKFATSSDAIIHFLENSSYSTNYGHIFFFNFSEKSPLVGFGGSVAETKLA